MLIDESSIDGPRENFPKQPRSESTSTNPVARISFRWGKGKGSRAEEISQLSALKMDQLGKLHFGRKLAEELR